MRWRRLDTGSICEVVDFTGNVVDVVAVDVAGEVVETLPVEDVIVEGLLRSLATEAVIVEGITEIFG